MGKSRQVSGKFQGQGGWKVPGGKWKFDSEEHTIEGIA